MQNDDIIESFPGLSLAGITLNDDTHIDMQEGSILLLVGPNNAGKSQLLNDIYQLFRLDYPNTVVAKKINPVIHPDGDFSVFLSRFAKHDQFENMVGINFSIPQYVIDQYPNTLEYSILRDLFVNKIDTASRLSACTPSDLNSVDEPAQSPIQFVSLDKATEKRISASFEKAFGKKVIPDRTYGPTIPLRISDHPVHVEGGALSDTLEEIHKKIDSLPFAHAQGDGMKSYLGILLHLCLKYHRVFLIDEPEAFLHPPQAFALGQSIAEELRGNQQAVISTHSMDFIKGIVESATSHGHPLSILYITRDGDKNHFSRIPQESIDKIQSDSLLRHSNFLDGLFYKRLILCESDSDCKMYSIIQNHLDQKAGSFSDSLFTQCGGKSAMVKSAEAMRELKIPFLVVVDMDLLKRKKDVESLYNACGGHWDAELEQLYDAFDNALPKDRTRPTRREAAPKLLEILEKNLEDNISDDDAEALRNLTKEKTFWDSLKRAGVSVLKELHDQTAYASYAAIEDKLQQIGVFIVSAGELESFVQIPRKWHGPKWVNEVLQLYPDLDDDIYADIRNFVAGLKAPQRKSISAQEE